MFLLQKFGDAIFSDLKIRISSEVQQINQWERNFWVFSILAGECEFMLKMDFSGECTQKKYSCTFVKFEQAAYEYSENSNFT